MGLRLTAIAALAITGSVSCAAAQDFVMPPPVPAQEAPIVQTAPVFAPDALNCAGCNASATTYGSVDRAFSDEGDNGYPAQQLDQSLRQERQFEEMQEQTEQMREQTEQLRQMNSGSGASGLRSPFSSGWSGY